RAMANFNIAEDFGAGADHHAVADFRMPVFILLAGAAERHVVEKRDVVFDHCGLADHKPSGMIEEDAAPDPRRRMNIALKYRRRPALQVEREIAAALLPQPMRQPIGP